MCGEKPEEKHSKLEIERHSFAHVLACAVFEMFPEAKFAIGPVIEHGFYYDIETPRTLIPEDLEILTEKMRAIIKRNVPFERESVEIAKARALFDKAGQRYKVELIDDLAKEGHVEVSVYKTGPFIDLCRGPHVDSTGELNAKSFKLEKIAAAYWKGDEHREQLQRVYGLAFANATELHKHLEQQEEAKRRDHRVLGKQLELFMFDSLIGQGLPLWLPKGTIIREELEQFLYEEQKKRGYLFVRTPHIGNLELYKTSGHWKHYRDDQYSPIKVDKEEYLLKPMNCPHHVAIYKNAPRSHKDLPMRLAEFGMVYRYEQSGELGGLTRARGFTVDDAHIFVTPDQVHDEFLGVVDLIMHVFRTIGFEDFRVRFGVRDPKSTKYEGDDALWKKAEADIESALNMMGKEYSKEEGEAAFYGPKLDFIVRDVLNREWQLGTVQVDYNLPERFEAEYIGADNKKHRPVMIHRAPFGSFERFIGILIEHFAGAFPLWLSPVQAVVVPVSDAFEQYGHDVETKLRDAGLRVEFKSGGDTLNKRIRDAEKQKVPYILVVGERERDAGGVNVRTRGVKEHTQELLDAFTERTIALKRERSLKL